MTIHRKIRKLYPKPLEECSKEEDKDGVSEYDHAMAFNLLPDEFSNEDFSDMLHKVIIDRTLQSMVQKDLIEQYWDEKSGNMLFKLKEQK